MSDWIDGLMTKVGTGLIRGLEHVIGRRQLVRISRLMLNYARRDGPNKIARNGELLVQRDALASAGDHAVVFDVGANLGQWSSHLIGQSVGRLDLHVFEPSAGCVARLRETLRSGGRITVTINQQAASSERGEATLYKPHELAGSSSLHEAHQGVGGEAMSESIRMETLDAYTQDHCISHIDLLKIDAEGHDQHVMIGATELLRSAAIDMVQFEYNHRWIGPRHFLKDVFDHVTPLGYCVGKVTPRGIEWYERWVPQLETFIEANFVAALPAVVDRLPSVSWWAEADVSGRR